MEGREEAFQGGEKWSGGLEGIREHKGPSDMLVSNSGPQVAQRSRWLLVSLDSTLVAQNQVDLLGLLPHYCGAKRNLSSSSR